MNNEARAGEPAGPGPRYAFTRIGGVSLPRWHLDLPQPLVPYEVIDGSRFKLRGWVLAEPGPAVRIAVKGAGVTRSYRLNETRGDVIEKVLKEPHADHPQLKCGFDIELAALKDFDLGFEIDGFLVWIFNLSRLD